MQLKKSLHSLLLLLSATLMLTAAGSASAQTQESHDALPRKEAKKVLQSVVSGYSDWSRVELNGKVSSPLLPISATARIYMEKGKLVMISLRAPIVGEAARVEIDNDSILIVNKLKRKYCRYSLSSLEGYPNAIGDVQSLLLGRLTVFNRGTLRSNVFNKMAVYAGDDRGYYAVPADDLQPKGGTYGYAIDSAYKLTTFMLTAVNEEFMTTITYQWNSDNSYTETLYAAFGEKTAEATLSFDTPKFGAGPMQPFVLTDRYRRASLREVLKM